VLVFFAASIISFAVGALNGVEPVDTKIDFEPSRKLSFWAGGESSIPSNLAILAARPASRSAKLSSL
jgi:hypothetical protein